MSDNKTGASRRILLCTCNNSFAIDADALALALGGARPGVFHQLCCGQAGRFKEAVSAGEPLLVACTQEAELFSELASEVARGAEGGAEEGQGEEQTEGADLAFTNIRERAGWSSAEAGALTPKFAALLAEAAYTPRPARLAERVSHGACLVYGSGQSALDAAQKLSSRLSVSLLLRDPEDALVPSQSDFPIARGRITRAQGAIGGFALTIDGYALLEPWSREAMGFAAPQGGVAAHYDLILDLSGEPALFPEPGRRDGYHAADPRHPAAIAEALFNIADQAGTFEKPLYVTYDAHSCAHSRNGKIGCRKCLDACPTGAIRPDGDHVAFDPWICGGCGHCAALCPTGAASYAFPAREDLIGRAQTLIGAYGTAGGTEAILLIHESRHGGALIDAMARFGRGLPANVLPFAVYSITELGHEVLAAALVAGVRQIVLLAPAAKAKARELDALEDQIALTRAFLSGLGFAGEPLHLIAEDDPQAVEDALYALGGGGASEGAAVSAGRVPLAFVAQGSKRDVARTVLAKLREAAPPLAPGTARPELIALPSGAPYGRITVNAEGCTLCLACISACPAAALGDNPDRPQLRFTEAACVQCGLCVATCPEKVITLEPRYNFSSSVMTPLILKEEEPFACISCGKPFGTKSAIERVIGQLQGQHWMFQSADRIRLIQMCDDCRVITLAEEGGDPFAMGERPRVRTTDDDLRERAEAEALARRGGKKAEDFIN